MESIMLLQEQVSKKKQEGPAEQELLTDSSRTMSYTLQWKKKS
jgi:hypothetical protein